MNVSVKTIEGVWEIPALKASTTVAQLVEILQLRVANTSHIRTSSPPPSAPLKLIHKGLRVREGTLTAAGIKDGDTLVALVVRAWLEDSPVERPKAADKATIIEVTTEEARSRGTLDSAAVAAAAAADEAAAAAARRRRGPRGQMHAMEAQILDMLEQAAPGFVAGNLVADGLVGEEGAEEGEEGPLQVPEPNAELLTQLGDMGFPEGLAKKALLLSRNRFEVAVEYCLTQGDDAHANDPPTEAQLRRVYGRNPAARARFNMQQPEPDAALVQQLTDMGFPADQSASALRRFHNNAEVACQWLLSAGAAFASGGAQDQSGAQQLGEGQEQGAAQHHGEFAEGMDDGDDSVSSMGGLEREDGFLGEDSEGDGDSSDGDEHEHEHEHDDDDDDDDDDHSDEHEMPLPAEDDYEDGLQDMDGDMAMGEMDYMEDFGGIDIHDLLSRVEDPHFLAEMTHSPQMIDAVQLLLQDPQSYAPLVEHPELAPVMRALRRMVGMEDSSPAGSEEGALPQTPQVAQVGAPGSGPSPSSASQPGASS